MTVTVTQAGGPTVPTGTAHVAENGTSLCTADLSGGSATCHMSDTALPPGGHQLTASYDGDTNFDPAQGSAQVIVEQDLTTTALTLPAATLGVNQEAGARLSYRIAAVASIPSLPPTGMVTISDGSAVVCISQVSATTGSCALTAAQLSPGTYNLTATYTGDANFAGSTSDPQTLTITQAATTKPTSTTLTLSAPRATFGHEQAERLSVHVTADSGTPAGQVTIKAGSANVCVITLAQGAGSCTPGATSLRPGKYQLTARYAGSTAFKASASGHKALTVAAEPTATTLKLSAAKVRSGHEQAEHLSVQVKPRFSGTPTGKVTIKAGAVKVCVITLKNGKGTCTLKASQLRAGTYHLAAGDAAAAPYAGSTSAKKALTVTK